jgi:hypothetical protein
VNIDEILDVGRQSSPEIGEWMRPGCVLCGRPNTAGSWCETHHPSIPGLVVHADSRDRCRLCGRPLVDGIEHATGICHLCRDRMLRGLDD